MRVLLIADRSFATREHTMLRRLEIGLIDEGVRVVRATPRGCLAEPTTGLEGSLHFNDRAWKYIMPAPERTLTRELVALSIAPRADSDEDIETPIDLIHAFGDQAALIALSMASHIECAALVEVWSANLCARMASIERKYSRPGHAPVMAIWLAPDEAILDAAKRSATRWPVMPTRWGVHAKTAPRPVRKPDAPIALCVLSSGREPHSVIIFLEGLARAAASHQNVLAFLDNAAVDQAPAVWRKAAELGLLDRVSVIADMESRRDLVLGADILVQPETRGEHRTIITEAMASGVAVLARADPLVAGLHAPQALTVLDGTAPAWEHALLSLFTSAEQLERLGKAARNYASTHCSAHHQVEATLKAYHACAPVGAIPITAS